MGEISSGLFASRLGGTSWSEQYECVVQFPKPEPLFKVEPVLKISRANVKKRPHLLPHGGGGRAVDTLS